jgi:hypothetical protein
VTTKRYALLFPPITFFLLGSNNRKYYITANGGSGGGDSNSNSFSKFKRNKLTAFSISHIYLNCNLERGVEMCCRYLHYFLSWPIFIVG